jgi:inhibitor of cysteine peptidase
VRLYGNLTTGFDWEVDDGIDGVLTQDGEKRVELESELSGAGATFTFRFIATEPGEAALRLIYHRPFEEGIDPLFAFEATVMVADNVNSG